MAHTEHLLYIISLIFRLDSLPMLMVYITHIESFIFFFEFEQYHFEYYMLKKIKSSQIQDIICLKFICSEVIKVMQSKQG